MKKAASGHERRRHPRVIPEKGHPVLVDISGDGFIDILPALDISLGGIGIQVPHNFDGCNTETLVDCLVTLPRPVNYTIRAQGKIIHIRQNLFGMSFRNLHEDSQAILKQYIDYILVRNLDK